MKQRFTLSLASICIATFPIVPVVSIAAELEHEDQAVEEIIVTSTLHRSRADTALTVNILAGEELREKVGATLGDTLQDQIGVTIASFGPGVGAPVIRGHGANRVQVLQGGVGNIDASSISADHSSSLEPSLAERIEVLRGPATLLYGNGAIGGVVNVIDNRIPTSLPDSIGGLIETRNNSASDQQVSVVKLEGAAGQLAWHLDGIYRDSNDVEVKGFAINPTIWI
ncbi:MAG: TonB-dependent receptor [Gammaproteobacteria bacterium]|nr:TonB-dependent receptor [Gammaproteobacteria bacterium]